MNLHRSITARTRDLTAPLPPRRFIRQCEAHAYLGRQVAQDAAAAGTLPVICRKQGKNKAALVFYARADVLAVEQMIMEGRYPMPKPQ